MEENKKISFFKRMIYSIKDFEKYQIFAFEKLSSAIKYFLKLVIIYTIIVAISILPSTIKEVNSGIEFLKNEIPEFEYKDNKLSVKSEEAIIIPNEEDSIILIVDTNTNEQTKIDEYIKKIGGYQNGILLLNDRLVYKQGSSINTNIIPYEQLNSRINISDFTKQEIVNDINNQGYARINTYISLMIFANIYVSYLLESLLIAVEIGLFAFILARISGLKLKFSSCYNIAIYSLTLSTIIEALAIVVNVLFNFEIKYLDIMYLLISYVYVITAILMIKSDLIKRHIELMSIQAKIKQEIEDRNQEKEEEKEKEEPKDENKKPKDKDEDKNKNDGEENVGKEANGEA